MLGGPRKELAASGSLPGTGTDVGPACSGVALDIAFALNAGSIA